MSAFYSSPKTKYLFVDSNSLIHRAFHAVAQTMNAADGTPTNAVFGFFSMFFKLLDVFQPEVVVCAFDKGVPQARKEAVQDYKAQRPPTDPALKAQFPVIQELLSALNIPLIQIQDYEGDDILGSLATQALSLLKESDKYDYAPILLVSSDKDICQLVGDKVNVVSLRKGMSDYVVYDKTGVFERFGVKAEVVPDYLGLIGDSSDNIPGVPNIGPKGAVKLLTEYGNLETILDNAANIPGRTGEMLSQHRDAGERSKFAAQIVLDAPIDAAIFSDVWTGIDVARTREQFSRYGLFSTLKQIDKKFGVGSDPKSSIIASDPKLDTNHTTTVMPAVIPAHAGIHLTQAELNQQSLEVDKTFTYIELYSEHSDELFSEDTLKLIVGQYDTDGKLSISEHNSEIELELVKLLKSGKSILSPSFAQLYALLLPPDSAAKSYITAEELLTIDTANFFDLSLAHWILDPKRELEINAEWAMFYLQDSEDAGSLAQLNYTDSSIKCEIAFKLMAAMTDKLIQRESLTVLIEIEQPLTPILAVMQYNGVALDVPALDELNVQLTTEIATLHQQAAELAQTDFNIDSPKQVGEVLFEQLGLPVVKKTKTGYSTDAAVLHELADKHAIVPIILRNRELTKLKNTYLDPLPQLRKQDGYIHTTFVQTGTETGRLSSRDPNLQNIPVRSDLGTLVRKCFLPVQVGSDPLFLSADYSQIELRLIAHLSGDENLIAAFQSGEDLHTQTAAAMFGVALSDVTAELRSRAKAINFGIIYGQGPFGLAQSLGISQAEAKSFIEAYYEQYPQVREYLDQTIAQAHELGYSETIFGRRRFIPELSNSNHGIRAFGERQAINHPAQGSAADIIKLAMQTICQKLSLPEINILAEQQKLMLQIHDELCFSVLPQGVAQLTALLTEAMTSVVELKVPLVVNISTGSNWEEAH